MSHSTQAAQDYREGGPQGFPWHHVIGFVVSIVLTLIALWLVTNHLLPPRGLLAVILVLGALQIGVQLFFFMHVTESPGPKYHVMALSLGLMFTVVVVGGSIWIMTFGWSQAY